MSWLNTVLWNKNENKEDPPTYGFGNANIEAEIQEENKNKALGEIGLVYEKWIFVV